MLAKTRTIRLFFSFFTIVLLVSGCNQSPKDKRIKQLDPSLAAAMAAQVDSVVKPELADGLTLKLWGVDSLVISPIAIDIDDDGSLYYTTTDRQKNSEFDIRGHQDWEIPSIQLQTIEDKRAFLRKELSPENSARNTWLKDLNNDGSHDWRDLTVEKENIYRLVDTDGDGVADQSQLVVSDFHDEVTDVSGGILKDGDDLYVAVGPDMWRMKDKDGDGIADEKTSMSHGYGIHVGFSGHGMSGVEMGPDGRIYWQIGDIGFNGTDKSGKKWDFSNSGVIARSNPDGSDFEIFASGNRNTHEFVFDEYANLISEDNDGDHAGESERLVYIVNGADIGWRSSWQYGKYRDPDNNTYNVWMDEKMYIPRFEGQAAYITPCIKNYVNGPTGMVYNPGTALGPKYKNTFFIAEFVGNPSRSAVHAFKLKPNGATFELGETRKILSGILPTGLDFGPDGALYVADWIDGWGTRNYGRIWKLDDEEGAAWEERKQTKTLLAADFGKNTDDELGELLTNPDMRVRMKAQFQLVKRGAKGHAVFESYLKQQTHQLARVQSIWGIAQMARERSEFGKTLIPFLKDSDPEIRAQAAKWLGDIRYKDAAEPLIPVLKDTFSRAGFFAAEALGRIGYEPAIQPLIELIRSNNEKDAYIRHATSLALARIDKAAPIVTLAKDPNRSVRIAAVVALRRMGHAGIADFLQDADEYIVTEAARGINDDHSIKAALPALGNLLKTTSFANEALIRRAINANQRVGTEEALQNLIGYALNITNPVAMRTEALATLSHWSKPSVVDRVDGRYRGVINRDPSIIANNAKEAFLTLLKSNDELVRISAAKAISKTGIKEASPVLYTILQKDPKPAVREEAIKALATLQYEQIGDAIRLALNDKEKSVRVAGVDLVTKMDIPKALMVKLLSDVIDTKTSEEKQAALLTLGSLPVEHTKPVMDALLTKMSKGTLPREILLELGEAVDSSRSPELIAAYKEAGKGLSADTLTAAYSGSLYGGDVSRGRRIFFRSQSAQCIRCHSYDDMGGTAGPRLNGIASKLTRPQLLASLIDPSARVAPGFGMVLLELKDGKTKSGTLIAESNTILTIKGDKQDEEIRKDDVAKRTDMPSSMPDMKYILSKKEIRDLVSFLATMTTE